MDSITRKQQIIGRNGFALSKTSGKSMRPLIWGGVHCVVVAPLAGAPAVGDLLMFEMTQPDGSRKSIVHRLVEIRKGECYVMRGDNCLGSEVIRREDIVGRVTEVHRLGGWRPWHVIPKRRFAVTDRSYQLYSRLWMALWPLRSLAMRAWRAVKS